MKPEAKSTQELIFKTSDETDTILLCNLCEQIWDINEKDLFKHQQHFEFILSESCKNSPHLVEQNMQALGLINKVFLIAAQYGPLAQKIYVELHEPIKAL